MWNTILNHSTPIEMCLIFRKSPFSQPFYTPHQLNSWLENSTKRKKMQWKCSNQNIFPYFYTHWREIKEEFPTQFISSPEIKHVFANNFSLYKRKALCVSVRLYSTVVKLTDNPHPELLQSPPCMFSKPSIPLAAGQLFEIVPLLQITDGPGLICHPALH